MTDMPAPMTPQDCDLRGYDYMPLLGNRLFNSHLYRKAIRDPRAGLAAIKLWWVAWLQCPAGSLPDDDDDLAMLADFGLDTKGWLKVRVLALHGFVKCSDGRLYHPVIAEQAIIAFEARKRDRERKASYRARKAGQNADTNGRPKDVPRDKTRTEDGTETGRKTGQNAPVPAERRGEGEERRGEDFKKALAPREAAKLAVSNPTLNDDASAWRDLADSIETSDHDGQGHPVVNGSFLDLVAFRVCELASINGHSRPLDWQPLIGWLRDGFEPEEHIYPVIKRLASRPSYSPPRFLTYFDQAIRSEKAA